jgi:general secretion pathway protein D
MNRLTTKSVLLIGLMGLSGCASIYDENYKVRPSLFEGQDTLIDNSVTDVTDKGKKPGKAFSRLKSMAEQFGVNKERPKVAATFSNKEKISFTVDKMKMNEFIHHVFGGVLGVNYVIHNDLTAKVDPVTLNFQNKISKKQAFLATSEVLTSKQIGVSVKDGVYYLYPLQSDDPASINIGVGRNSSELPLIGNNVLQIMPMNYGVTIAIERTLRQLTDIAVTVDFDQSAVFLQGERAKVKKVMELARILDMPSNKGKHIGLLRLTYINSDEFSSQVTKLLASEGIPVGIGSGQQKNVVLVPITQIGLVAVFASNKQFLQRVRYWQDKIDQPGEGNEKRYFWYEPQNARARDLGTSLTPLIGGSAATATPTKGNSSRDTRSALVSSTARAKQPTVAMNSDMSMVVDERTNTLIFSTTGKQYQKLLPLIKRMDTLPRQVILETTIAEVTLTDGFKHGVEFAVQNGDFGYASPFNNVGGGFGGAWSLLDDKFNFNLVQTNNLINILSNPSLLVRDGVSASIVVGSEIPLTTGVLSNPLGGTSIERSTFERRQTGLTLNVTPTINSQGIVIMEINLEISDADGENLLNRKVQTEVVANSGQTIILAGLISEKRSGKGGKVPFLGDIPVLGNLFKNNDESVNKTELVILVTPKIISDANQWRDIKNKFRKGLENVEF